MIDRNFFHHLKCVNSVTNREEGIHALKDLCIEYGLSHATYLGINIPSLTEQAKSGKRIYYVSTYSPEWCGHYVQSNFIAIDPVIKNALMGILPFDWADLSRDSPQLKNFFGEANEHGIGRNGLSFPIRGAHGEIALFSINSCAQGKEWQELKLRCMRDFQIFAYHFHLRVLESEGVRFEQTKLSPRELECIQWAAAGKTAWETAAIIGIGMTTVKFFLENARVKLGAFNTTQAVAIAISRKLI
ncbi:MAG: hypothetical protein CTY39_02615 [Hyphomicrobium sp.]|nr:MAG: hypothetical protein CTY39_02615 [Hyphomicrobium sp.]